MRPDALQAATGVPRERWIDGLRQWAPRNNMGPGHFAPVMAMKKGGGGGREGGRRAAGAPPHGMRDPHGPSALNGAQAPHVGGNEGPGIGGMRSSASGEAAIVHGSQPEEIAGEGKRAEGRAVAIVSSTQDGVGLASAAASGKVPSSASTANVLAEGREIDGDGGLELRAMK